MHGLSPILLVEDNLNDVELAMEALAESHLANRVVHARDGVEAMQYLRREGKFGSRLQGKPAVAILDIKMPRMDGIEVLRAIRADNSLKDLPVVMLTSSSEERDLVQSYELGTNAYVVKPVDFSEFVKAVRQIGLFWALLNERPPEAKGSDE